MDKNYTQLNNRILILEKQIADLKQVSSIPPELEKAFIARGFLTTKDFIIGQTEVGISGTAIFGISGANKYSMAFATYADALDTGGVDSYIEPVTTGIGYQLHLEGISGKRINYVIFLNNTIKPDVTL